MNAINHVSCHLMNMWVALAFNVKASYIFHEKDIFSISLIRVYKDINRLLRQNALFPERSCYVTRSY